MRAASEAGFQDTFVQFFTLHRWVGYHTYDSRRSRKGFLDWILVRERVVFAELKSLTGRETPEQREWRERLTRAGAEVYLWTSRDWEEIERVLSD